MMQKFSLGFRRFGGSLRFWLLSLCLVSGSLEAGLAWAGPKEDATTMLEESKALFDKAQKQKKKIKGEKRIALLTESLKKSSRAYLLLVGRQLEKEAPELVSQIVENINAVNQLPEIAVLRRELLTKAIDSTLAGKLTDAYDQFSSLRDLDPRDATVDYALQVISQRM